MIAPLRRRHRRVFTVLALLLPVLFVAAMFVRREPPAQGELPNELDQGRVPLASQPHVPDPLLYWSPQPAVVGEGLPENARLLGALRSGKWYPLEGPTHQGQGGARFVYSLVDQMVTELLPPDGLPGGER